MNIVIKMKSGEKFNLEAAVGTLEIITSKLNKLNFMYFGPVILNVNEIESITKE